jgi:hypothetical protein
MVSLGKMFARIDVGALLRALENAPDSPPSLWYIGKELSTKDARRALTVGARVLNIAGRALDDSVGKKPAE